MIGRFTWQLTALLVAATLAWAAQRSPPSPTTSADIQAGEALYHGKANCVACHGQAGQGDYGPKLVGSRLREKAVAQIILEGTTGMSAYEGRLSSSEISQVTAYVLSLEP